MAMQNNGLMSRPVNNPKEPFSYWDRWGRQAAGENPYASYGLMTPTFTPLPTTPTTTPTAPTDNTDDTNDKPDSTLDTSRTSGGGDGGESGSAGGGNASDKSFGEMSDTDKIGFGNDMNAIGQLGQDIVSGAVSLGMGMMNSALGTATSKATGTSTFGNAIGATAAKDMSTAAAMASAAAGTSVEQISNDDLAAAQDRSVNDFGATVDMQEAHAEAVDAGNAPAGSEANAAGGYSTSGEFGFGTDHRGDVVGNDEDNNGIADSAEGGEGEGEGCHITTAMTDNNLMSKRQYSRYLLYCRRKYHGSWVGEAMRRGYQTWSLPVARAIRTNPNSYTSRIGQWVANTYADYVNAYGKAYTPSIKSRVLAGVLHPISFVIGVFVKRDTQKNNCSI